MRSFSVYQPTGYCLARNVGSTERYRYRKSIGLCPMCGNREPETGRSLCKQCQAKCREEQRLKREQANEFGMCPICRKVKLYVGERKCPDCLEKARKYAEKYRERHNELVRKYRKNHPKVDDGKCIYCHKRLPDDGYRSCAYCRAERRARVNARKKDKLTPMERPLYGLCYYCGEPVIDGKKVCQKHYDMCMSHLKRASTKDHWWRKDEHMRYEHIKKGKKS